MHIHNANPGLPQSGWDCGRSHDAASQVVLRRKSLAEVEATAPAAATAAPCATNACASVPATVATDTSTYDAVALRRQKGSLSILTQDGDTVRIRFRTSEGVAIHSQATSSDAGSTESTSVYAFASGRVKVEVNGELDADELKAIGDLLDKVDALATQFFDGDAQAAFAAASELGFDAGEIAGFALRLSVKEYARAAVSLPTPDTTPPQPQPTAPQSAPAAPTENVVPAVEAAAASVTPQADAPAAASPDPAAQVQQTTAGFLKQVMDSLSAITGSGRTEFSMRWKLQVMIEAVKSLPAAASEPAASQLATDSLDKLASTAA